MSDKQDLYKAINDVSKRLNEVQGQTNVLIDKVDDKAVANETNLSSDTFNTNNNYAEGEYTMWNNRLYLCLHDCKGVEPSDVNFWQEANIAKELNKLYSILKEGN